MPNAPLRLLPLLLLIPLLAPAPATSAGPSAVAAVVDDEIVREFRKYFRKFKDTATRVEAILALEGEQSAAVVEALVPILGDRDGEVVDAAVRVLGSFEARPAIDAVFTALAEEKGEAERRGLLRAVAAGGYQGGGEALAECLEDRSWTIRYRAVQALEARGEVGAAPRLAELCADREPAVRCAALEALATFRDEAVVDLAVAALADEVWQVRSSAALALRKVRARRAIEPLIACMEAEEGRLLGDYAAALEEITAKYFGMRTDQWRSWWDGIRDRFQIPTDEELAKAKARRAEIAAQYSPPGSTTYHGIETPSRRILFIIDVSGSMENLVVEKERFEDGDYPSMARIDIVKTELQRTIEGLEAYVELNVLAFATEVEAWKKGLVKCNVLNKKSAVDWVGKLEALGGNSKEDLARAGLTGAANLEAGKTNTFGALMRALEVSGRGSHDDAYEVAVDTIFFLSDGRPTTGELIDPDDILREVRAANRLRKVVIHTIAIGEFQKEFMKTLATENGGMFVDLGR